MMKQAGTATHVAQAIELGHVKAKYDAEVKNILSDKAILAWVLKYTVKELENYSIETIKTCIEGETEISMIPVYPGKSNCSKITGNNTEDKVVNEGEIKYDIRFYVILPDILSNGARKKLLINGGRRKEENFGKHI